MDTTGKIFLGITIVSVVCALIGFYVLSKKGPRGSVLGVAAVLYVLGRSIPAADIRELRLIAGILSFTGFIGGILGLIDLFRGRSKASESEIPVAAEIVEEVEGHE